MNWVTFIWAMVIAACFTMALPHFFIGIWHHGARANLLFAIAALSVAGIAATELVMMGAHTPAEIARAQQYGHVPIFVLVVAIVAFVRLYFGTGRWWLGIAACGTRAVCLLINFAFPANLNFREVTALRHLKFLGQTVSTPVGVASSWTRLGELSSLLVLAFVVDASVALWRQRTGEARRRAVLVGGGLVFFIVLAAGISALVNANVIHWPYLISLPFIGIIVTMSFELGYDVLRAGQLARRLEATEAAQRESEVRFRIAADAAPVLIWMAGVNKLCNFFNRPWLEFTGRSLEQEVGNGWADGVHPDDLQKCLNTYTTAFDAREPFVIQFRLKRNDSEYRWVSDSGVPRYSTEGNFAGYIGSCMDVTELIEKDHALHASEERMRLATDAVNLGIWEWDLQTDEIWAPASRRAVPGWAASGKIRFEDFLSHLHPDDRGGIRLALEDALQKGKDYDCDYRVILPDGKTRWMSARGKVHLNGSGEPARIVGISIDITARKQAELEAKQRSDELNHLSRLALLGEMSASLAHELNQPLSSIVTNASAGQRFIESGNVNLQEIRELLADINADGHRAGDVVRGIRSMVKKEKMIRKRINLNDVVLNVVRLVTPDALLHSCALQTSLEESLPAIEADPIQLQQVLLNLIMNAFDAMRDVAPSKRKIEITTEENGDETVATTVRDYGIGISEEVKGFLFDRFFTMKAEGLGMGLAIVRSIVEAHAGRIVAENAEGGGARFHFTLPIVARA